MILCIGAIFAPGIVFGQAEDPIVIEESAEVSLEDYTDEFQESFFEGLKQKGIQNYDKAINAFLKCKEMEPEKDVISFELAKAYLSDKQFINAQQYAEEAITKNPSNYWYAHTLAEIIKAQNSSIAMVKHQVPWENEEFKSNLAQVYYKMSEYEQAKSVLKELKKTRSTIYLTSKINDSIAKEEAETKRKSLANEEDVNKETNDLLGFEKKIEGLINGAATSELLLQVTEEALERYPSQPFFYYAHGYALNRSNRNQEAIEALEAALDYLISDVSLENKIYGELAEAYKALGNLEKATEYQNKVKPGF